MASRSLEDLLVQTRVLSQMQVAVAKRDAETRRKRLAPTLIDLGMIDEVKLSQWMAQSTGLPVIHPLPEEKAQALARRLPRAIAREYEVVPIALDGTQMTIATMDPLDTAGLEVLRISTGMKIETVIARRSELQRLIARFYPEDEAEPTMLPEPMLDFEGDESPGSTTQVIRPRVPAFVAPSIDARVAALERSLKEIERRIAAIEASLERVLPR